MSDDYALTTERLTLTTPVSRTSRTAPRIWGDPEVVRYIGGKPISRTDAWVRMQRQAGTWVLFGYGGWTVRERGTGRFVGEIGFGNYRREITPSFGDAPEAGWVLAPWAHGQGFASEAVAAAHAWGDTRFVGARTVCMIDPRNDPSLRVAARAGYVEFARTQYRDDEVVLLERPPARAAARSV